MIETFTNLSHRVRMTLFWLPMLVSVIALMVADWLLVHREEGDQING